MGLFWLPGAARLFPSSLAASEVPASPREDGDAEGKGRSVGVRSRGRAAVLQQSKGWHREVREGTTRLEADLGTIWEFVQRLGGRKG